MDIDIILFHSGEKLPDYLECTFKQLRIFNPDVIVWFLTDRIYIENDLFKKYNINPVCIEEYHSLFLDKFIKLFRKKENDFWTITAARLFYIESFIDKKKLTNVYHFENDVLIYYSFKSLHNIFIKNCRSLGITVGGEDKCMTGMFFIQNWASIFYMIHFFIQTLKRYGVNGTKIKYKMDMVNEMTLMKAFVDHNENIDVYQIPTTPFSKKYKQSGFNSIFDPASWGQYVGGTRDCIPGAKCEDHYIGQMLKENPGYNVIWKKDEQERKIPYFIGEGNEVKINNLHIHSKELHKYMSL